jgi:hypothetical protein
MSLLLDREQRSTLGRRSGWGQRGSCHSNDINDTPIKLRDWDRNISKDTF